MSIDSGSIWWQMLFQGAKISCALVTSYSNLFLITTACDNKCNDYPTSLSAMCLHFMWTTASLPFSYHQNKLDKNAVMHKLTMTAMVGVVSLMPFFCHCHREPNKEQKTYNERHTVTLAHICTITLFQVEISSDHLALFQISWKLQGNHGVSGYFATM